MSPNISVIIPTLNSDEYIERCIRSILNQSYNDLEIVIIDDGSTDDTIKIIKNFSDDRIRLFTRNETGIPSARNYGIKVANGEYIANQDSDDWSNYKRLEKQLEYYNNTNYDLIGTGCYNVDDFGDIISKREVIKDPNIDDFQFGSPFVHGSLFTKKSVLENINGYNENYSLAEDVELIVRAMEQGYKYGNMNKPFYNFRHTGDSSYRSNIREAKLYGYHAVNKSKFDISPNEFISLSDNKLSDYMSNNELRLFYIELAKEYTRLNRSELGRKYAIKCGVGIMPFLVIILTLVPPIIRSKLIKVYRENIVNSAID